MSKTQSIARQVDSASHALMVIMAIPVVLSLSIMLLYASRYQVSVCGMETVAGLKPLVEPGISEALWASISGRASFEECGAYDLIDTINDTLDSEIDHVHSSSRLALTVARRTMDTLLSYVRQIEQQRAQGDPVALSEQTLEEVRNVSTLMISMLEDYITEEINNTAQTSQLMRVIVPLTAVVELCIVLCAILFMRRRIKQTQRLIHEPIAHLEHFAGLLADGNLQARIPHTNVEELITLTDQVNVMADRLQNLIEQNRQEQENLKKSELRLLQAQINPHFLYNTLDAIIWQAESGHSDEVVHITTALSDFFRISLSSGADWIPVSQEIKHLTGYLSIQKTRYRDILTYRINIDEDMQDVYMLKLLLQPLVENALYHGIKNRRGGGFIAVTGHRENGMLHFTVADTGCGMTADQLHTVLNGMHGGTACVSSAGFGLHNVDQRIRLYYGQDEGLHIESGSGGTTVSFSVPCRAREENTRD